MDNRWARWVRYAVCGALIGAGAVLPGVSGGVLAVVFGIYRPFMETLTHPKQALPRYWPIFLPLGVGWAAGFLLFARGIALAIGFSVTVTTWLFIGLIAGTVPALFREAGREGRTAASWTSLALCALGVFAGLFYLGHVRDFTAEPNLFWYAFCGVLWGTGIVIPGFSASPVMMALGLYQPVLEGMSHLDVSIFAASLPAMGLTAASLARFVTWLFRRFHSVTFHGILGIVLASTAAIVPTEYPSAHETVCSALCFAGGFCLAFFLERLDRRLRTE